MDAKVFAESFYGIWFCHLPEAVIDSAIAEVERESLTIKRRCPRIYAEYITLKTALFLMTFLDVDAVCLDVNGVPVNLRALSNSGAVAYVKKDAIDSSVSREYHKPELPAGTEPVDFPLGRLKNRVTQLEKACNMVALTSTGYSTGVANCGMGNRTIQKNDSPCQPTECN